MRCDVPHRDAYASCRGEAAPQNQAVDHAGPGHAQSSGGTWRSGGGEGVTSHQKWRNHLQTALECLKTFLGASKSEESLPTCQKRS